MNPSIKIQTKHAWQKGYAEGIQIGDKGIFLDKEICKHGWYMGEIIDSGETGHEWSRMRYTTRPRSETSILLWTLSVDYLIFEYEDKPYNLEELLEQQNLSLKNLTTMLQECQPHCHDNQSDILLYQEKGRYLIYWFELISEGDSAIVTGAEVFYEKLSWLNYLPQIYSEDSDFLEQYLAIFQTVHEEIEEVIDQMATVYKPESTEATFLEVLNEWLPVDGFSYLNEAQKRLILSQYPEFNRPRGTRAGILKYVSLYTDGEAFIVEYKDFKSLKDSGEHSKIYKQLYTDSPYGFTLLVRADVVKHRKQVQALEAIMKQIVPAQVIYKIAKLSPYMVLGDYTYLGVNSNICNQTEIKLDEQPLLSTGTIGE